MNDRMFVQERSCFCVSLYQQSAIRSGMSFTISMARRLFREYCQLMLRASAVVNWELTMNPA